MVLLGYMWSQRKDGDNCTFEIGRCTDSVQNRNKFLRRLVAKAQSFIRESETHAKLKKHFWLCSPPPPRYQGLVPTPPPPPPRIMA